MGFFGVCVYVLILESKFLCDFFFSAGRGEAVIIAEYGIELWSTHLGYFFLAKQDVDLAFKGLFKVSPYL